MPLSTRQILVLATSITALHYQRASACADIVWLYDGGITCQPEQAR